LHAYAVGSRLRPGTTFTGRRPLSYRLISAAFLRDLAEIMVLIDLNGLANKICEQFFAQLHAFLRLFDEAEMKLEIHIENTSIEK
jgi:hypothetical protein